GVDPDDLLPVRCRRPRRPAALRGAGGGGAAVARRPPGRGARVRLPPGNRTPRRRGCPFAMPLVTKRSFAPAATKLLTGGRYPLSVVRCGGGERTTENGQRRTIVMYLDYTPEQKKLRDHLRKYFANMMTPALRAELVGSEGGGPEYQKALEKMGADGWIGIGWPK